MKIRSISFSNDPILGSLDLDFQIKGQASSTIYVAGENGTGKTAILNAVFRLANIQPSSVSDGSTISYRIQLSQQEVVSLSQNRRLTIPNGSVLDENIEVKLVGEGQQDWSRIKLFATLNGNRKEFPGHILADHETKGIFKILFSDVAINFTPKDIASVTAKNLDEVAISQKTNHNLATEITQLMIDVQALDDADLSRWVRENKGQIVDEGVLDRRISRFQKAFSSMFPSKHYKEIRNVGGKKQVVFNDSGRESFIGDLSSGEKQIVFRGGFFLKDLGAAVGAVGLIDEPEISLHPDWQLKIMSFYKSILDVSQDKTKSQIIVATHSPFVLQNYDKNSEKIIVLKRGTDGAIVVEKEPTFYGWTHEKAIREAFEIKIDAEFSAPLILVEGETDERYLNEAVKKLGVDLEGAEIRWVGRIGERGDAEFTGDKALNHTLAFAKSNPEAVGRPLILLYDSDTNKPESDHGFVAVRTMPFKREQNIKKGIENLIRVPNDLDIIGFASVTEKTDDYGMPNTIRKLDKAKFCDYIIEMSRAGDNDDLFEDFRGLFQELRDAVDCLSGR
jgi:ABC-type cobalamin/Fe3+-siderophores transport system ATPase subunit